MNINFYEYTIGDKTTYLEPEYMGYKYSDTKKLGSVSGQTDLSIYYSPPCESTPTCVNYAVLKRDEDGYDPCGPLYETKKRDTEYCDPNTAYWSSDLFGFYTTPTNVTVEMTGYFLAPENGSYTFSFYTVDDSAILSIGGDNAFACCEQQQSSVTSTNFTIDAVGGNDGSSSEGSVYLYAGYYYPMKIVFSNAEESATLPVAVSLPNGTSVMDDFSGYVYSFENNPAQDDLQTSTYTGLNGLTTEETVFEIQTPTATSSSMITNTYSSASTPTAANITTSTSTSSEIVTSSSTSASTSSEIVTSSSTSTLTSSYSTSSSQNEVISSSTSSSNLTTSSSISSSIPTSSAITSSGQSEETSASTTSIDSTSSSDIASSTQSVSITSTFTSDLTTSASASSTVPTSKLSSTRSFTSSGSIKFSESSGSSSISSTASSTEVFSSQTSIISSSDSYSKNYEFSSTPASSRSFKASSSLPISPSTPSSTISSTFRNQTETISFTTEAKSSMNESFTSISQSQTIEDKITSTASHASTTVPSLAPVATEKREQTTFVTITSCGSNICSKTVSPALISTSTTTVKGVATEYTTWYPISSSKSTRQTTLVTVTSCESGICSETASPAIISTATTTINDAVTVYTRWCSLTANDKGDTVEINTSVGSTPAILEGSQTETVTKTNEKYSISESETHLPTATQNIIHSNGASSAPDTSKVEAIASTYLTTISQQPRNTYTNSVLTSATASVEISSYIGVANNLLSNSAISIFIASLLLAIV
nr:ALI_HP1_G0017960.mRNA.1.CDS.1 [Saccharomyces cerevisiae]